MASSSSTTPNKHNPVGSLSNPHYFPTGTNHAHSDNVLLTTADDHCIYVLKTIAFHSILIRRLATAQLPEDPEPNLKLPNAVPYAALMDVLAFMRLRDSMRSVENGNEHVPRLEREGLEDLEIGYVQRIRSRQRLNALHEAAMALEVHSLVHKIRSYMSTLRVSSTIVSIVEV